MDTQKNGLLETVLLSSENTCFELMGKKILTILFTLKSFAYKFLFSFQFLTGGKIQDIICFVQKDIHEPGCRFETFCQPL